MWLWLLLVTVARALEIGRKDLYGEAQADGEVGDSVPT